ncbi:hypothetical protein M8J76_005457 [Diaphorina citri]|nr:hypothetical protein M8J76_005457 [Diaphorina citri]
MDEWTLNDLLECSVCLDRLDTSSKVLPCQHTFCKKCLEEIVSSHKELRCPECRVLVECKVDELPPNVLLMRILEGMRNNPRKRPGHIPGGSSSNPSADLPSPSHTRQSSGEAPCNLTPQHIRQKSNELLTNLTNHQRQRSAELLQLNESPRSQPVSKSGPGGHPYARAIYDYASKEPGDLNFKKDDIVILRRKIDNNWFYGEVNGTTGAFPMSYVQIMTPLPTSHIPQCKALYDFRMNNNDEEGCLKFTKGEIITVIRRVDENWAEGRLADKIGIFPLAFVEMNSVARALMKLSTNSQPGPSRNAPPTPTPASDDATPLISTSNPPVPPQSIVIPALPPPTPLTRQMASSGSHTSPTSPSSSSTSSSPTVSSNTNSTSTSSSSSTESTPTSPPPSSLPTPSKRHSFSHLVMVQHGSNSASQPSTPHRYSAEILSSIKDPQSDPSSSQTKPSSHGQTNTSPSGNNSTQAQSNSPQTNASHSQTNSSHSQTNSSHSQTNSSQGSTSHAVSSPCHQSPSSTAESTELKRQPSLRSYKKLSGGSAIGSPSVPSPSSPHISLKTPALYIAIYPYKPQKDDELELRRGSVYTVTERCQDGWFKGTSQRTQRSGVFPGNYVAPAKSLPALQAQLRGLRSGSSSSPSRPHSSPSSSSATSTSAEPPRLSTPKNRPNRIGGVLSASTPPDLPPRSHSPNPSSTSTSWHGGHSTTQETARSSLLVIPPPNVSVPNTPVSASGAEKKKDKSSGGGVSLMRRLTNITSKSKSPPPPCYSMDNPVFEDSTISTMAPLSSVTPTSSVHTPHIHVRSDSCPSKLLGHVSAEHRMLSPASSQRSKHKDRPSAINHFSPRPVDAVVSESSSSTQHNHRKSNSLDASSASSPVASDPNNRKPKPQPVPTVRERFRCIVPYPPNSEYELELRVGDLIYVHKKRDDGWYKGTLQRTGRTGLFPASFVESF